MKTTSIKKCIKQKEQTSFSFRRFSIKRFYNFYKGY